MAKGDQQQQGITGNTIKSGLNTVNPGYVNNDQPYQYNQNTLAFSCFVPPSLILHSFYYYPVHLP